MECNRDKAQCSRSIAEQKFLQHDLMGAKKFALKAQCLFPDLEGLPQLLAVLDVLIEEQRKVDGMEVNWYRILQTDSSADEATIRKQYRKLALILHPDKNNYIGAEGAFKLISEAWHVLSDKDKKAAYDARRSIAAFDYRAAKSAKGVRNFTHFSTFFQQKPAESSKKSFWTCCPSCKMQYQYLRAHENKIFPCSNCFKVSRAADFDATDTRAKSPSSEKLPQDVQSRCFEKQAGRDKDSPMPTGSSFSAHWGNLKYGAAKQAATVNATAEMVQQIYDTVRQERIKAQKDAREKAAMLRMEAEKEALRMARRDWKLKRKDLQEMRPAKASACSDGCLDNGVANPSRLPKVESVNDVPMKGVVENETKDACLVNFGSNQKKEAGTGIGDRAATLDQMPEPLGCRIRNNFDSSSSYDSGDAFSFPKRLKVDV